MKRPSLRTVVVLLAVLCMPVAADEVLRMLTSRDGVSIKAWIRKVENGQVTIRKDDGKVTTFPLDRLCDDDQNELRKMETKGGAVSPSAPPAGKPAESSGPAGPAVSKRVYPRMLDEMRTACAKIRTDSTAQKGFSDEEKAALADLNVYRYLAGVSPAVKLDRKDCEGADRASEACAKIGELSHEASREGKCCNLHQGQSSFAESVHGYIEDSGDNNRDARGHRAWCLHPDLGETGFGCDATKQFFAMWVSSGGGPSGAGSQRKKTRTDFYAWPGEGFCPANLMKGTGWTIYPGEPMGGAKPEIRVFQLSKRLDRPLAASGTPEGATEIKVGYLTVPSRIPAPHGCVLFEPEAEVKPGNIFWISLKAGTFRMSYTVEFVADKF